MNGGIARTLKPKLSGDTFANRDLLFAVAICYLFIIMSPGSRPGSRRDPGGFFQVNGGFARTLIALAMITFTVFSFDIRHQADDPGPGL